MMNVSYMQSKGVLLYFLLPPISQSSACNNFFRCKDKVSWYFQNGQTHSNFDRTSCNHIFGVCMEKMPYLLLSIVGL